MTFGLPHTAHGQALKPDECVMPIPGIVKVPEAGQHLQAELSIWVYENERRPGLKSLFARYLDIDRDALGKAARERYERRTSLFLKDSESGKTVPIQVDGLAQPILMPETNQAGRSKHVVSLPRALWQGRGLPITYRIEGCHAHAEQGLLWPVEAEGLSIVSDIDDTIKVSEVQDKKQLLRNTFLKPFEATPGMVDWYRQMAGLASAPGSRQAPDHRAAADTSTDALDAPGAAEGVLKDAAGGHDHASATSLANAAARQQAKRAHSSAGTDIQFHYLSSSPLQLLPVLTEFLNEQQFPPGSLMLRESTSWRSLLPGDGDSEAHKQAQLRRLLTTFPKRQFILIGDSGEADPEIYAEVARQHPRQIRAIFIRDVTGEKADAPRYQRTFGSLPRKQWHIVRDGAEGLATFQRLGIR
ncbi:MAG: App1 family protein [Lautropia sp.]|nr:App1 family protein [Lautropia sp.]